MEAFIPIQERLSMRVFNFSHPLASTAESVAQGLTTHLQLIQGVISSRYATVNRVALATYDVSTDQLVTYITSDHTGLIAQPRGASLKDWPALQALAQARHSGTLANVSSVLSRSDASPALPSSFVAPMYRGDMLIGFLFFDAGSAAAFDPEACAFLDAFARLIAELYVLQLQVTHDLVGAVHLASRLARIRDLETGQHLERIAAYSRLMALALAGVQPCISPEFVEYVHLFAPLHDIGKVGIPDLVLLKPGALTSQETTVMRRHVEIGLSIVEQMGADLKMRNSTAFQVMRNIVAAHHERGDGSGYPLGLRNDAIPLEARIVAVADVYDALSNRRPYKEPWNSARIEHELREGARKGQLDAACVDILMAHGEERRRIAHMHCDAQA